MYNEINERTAAHTSLYAVPINSKRARSSATTYPIMGTVIRILPCHLRSVLQISLFS